MSTFRNFQYVWAEYDQHNLHAIHEDQVATTQSAFCEVSPRQGDRWHRASGPVLNLHKCKDCRKLVHFFEDITESVNRVVERADARDLQKEADEEYGQLDDEEA